MTDRFQTALSKSPLLCACAERSLSPVICSYTGGETVTDLLDGRPCVGLILSGRVSVSSDTPDGRDVRMNTLGEGDCFGISNLFDPEPLKTILRCEGPAEIAYIAKEALITLLEEDREFSMSYIRLTQQKLQFLLRRIELLTTQNHQVRLIVWLLGQGGEEIRFPGNREALAAHLGMSRAALFRELSQLDSAGMISTKGTLVRILNRPGLSALLQAAGQPMPDPPPIV